MEPPATLENAKAAKEDGLIFAISSAGTPERAVQFIFD
jgi:hypothetical protein